MSPVYAANDFSQGQHLILNKISSYFLCSSAYISLKTRSSEKLTKALFPMDKGFMKLPTGFVCLNLSIASLSKSIRVKSGNVLGQ